MIDRAKIIKGLECCAECGKCKSECPYDGKNNSMYGCTTRLAKDALELVKAHEPQEPEIKVCNGTDVFFKCPRCHKSFLYNRQRFCDDCGQAVKWE